MGTQTRKKEGLQVFEGERNGDVIPFTYLQAQNILYMDIGGKKKSFFFFSWCHSMLEHRVAVDSDSKTNL